MANEFHRETKTVCANIHLGCLNVDFFFANSSAGDFATEVLRINYWFMTVLGQAGSCENKLWASWNVQKR